MPRPDNWQPIPSWCQHPLSYHNRPPFTYRYRPLTNRLQASHLFTCASDPVETSYKRFAFPADTAAAATAATATAATAATAAATPAGGCACLGGKSYHVLPPPAYT